MAALAKYPLFFFNFLFVLTGLFVIIVGSMIEIGARDYFNFLGKGFTSTAVILIVVGVVIFFIAFLGCCGAIKENRCMILAFSILLFLVVLVEISGGVAAYVYWGKLKEILTDGMDNNLQKFNSSGDVQRAWNDMQKNLQCCGARNLTDYVKQEIPIPESCCSSSAFNGTEICNQVSAYPEGCAQTLFEHFASYEATLCYVGIGIACAQILGIILACCLARCVNKHSYVA